MIVDVSPAEYRAIATSRFYASGGELAADDLPAGLENDAVPDEDEDEDEDTADIEMLQSLNEIAPSIALDTLIHKFQKTQKKITTSSAKAKGRALGASILGRKRKR